MSFNSSLNPNVVKTALDLGALTLLAFPPARRIPGESRGCESVDISQLH